MAKEALLIVDLEGVAGVDEPAALLAGTDAWPLARARLTAEVNAAVEGLVAAGFTHVRVSDSHMSGSGDANVLANALHPAATLHFLDDWYDETLFDGVAAVACLGMHGPAGSRGFAAHTVDVVSRWSLGGRLVSESDLVLGLAAERGLPVVFVAGDDSLEAHLGPGVPFVRTKRTTSAITADSRPIDEVLAALREAGARPPVPAPALPDGPLRLDFHLVRQADVAARARASRVAPTSVEVSGSARQRYAQAHRVADAASPVLLQSVLPEAGSTWMVEDASALLRLGWEAEGPDDVGELARRTLGAFLALSEGPSDEARALRALTLHMLQGLAPGFFESRRLGPTLDEALASLADVPMGLGHVFDPERLQARVDAWYLRRLRGLPQEAPDAKGLAKALQHLVDSDDVIYAWLLGELGAKAGVDVRVFLPAGVDDERHFRGASRLHDLYWVTHLVLLDTDYFARPLAHAGATGWLAALLAGIPWALEARAWDVGAELLFCLAFAGETHAAAFDALLSALAEALEADGAITDADDGTPSAHATAAALLAFAATHEARRR